MIEGRWVRRRRHLRWLSDAWSAVAVHILHLLRCHLRLAFGVYWSPPKMLHVRLGHRYA